MSAEDNQNVSSKEIENSVPSESLLYLNSEYADVHFKLKSSDEKIPAHKLILAKKSSVCKAAFYGSMPENGEMKIEDENETIHPDAFKEFLQFFYLRKMKLSMEHIQSVMQLCHKYQMKESLNMCSTYLKENITMDELCLGYQLAIYYEQNDLKQFFQREISENTSEVLKSNGFLNCDWHVLNEVVKTDQLNCEESDLLEACINWAQNQCQRKKLNVDDKENIRNELKDVIYEIRFKDIKDVELAKYLEKNPNHPYNVDEMNDIFCMVVNKTIASTKFNCSSRSYPFGLVPWNESKKLYCQRSYRSTTPYDIPNIISAIFSSDKSFIFGEFGICILTSMGNRNISCKISIKRMDLKKEIVKEFIAHLPVGPNNFACEYILLPTPIIVEEEVKYKIQLDFSSNDNIQLKYHYNMKQEVELTNGAKITFHRDESSHFDIVEEGVINYLHFNEIES